LQEFFFLEAFCGLGLFLQTDFNLVELGFDGGAWIRV
jgi:hypothetical protein